MNFGDGGAGKMAAGGGYTYSKSMCRLNVSSYSFEMNIVHFDTHVRQSFYKLKIVIVLFSFSSYVYIS